MPPGTGESSGLDGPDDRSSEQRLAEALEQQAATAEILRVIARSPTDAQPVFDLVARRAGKLCNAEVAVVSRFDGVQIELAAIDGVVPEAVAITRTLFPMRLDARAITARVIRDSVVVHIDDVLADAGYGLKDFARVARYRAGLGVPIVRDGKVMGSIFVGRAVPGLFSDSQVELLETFADQAAIAIENVRLFNETKEALDQQTSTAEILKAISSSPGNLQPVLDSLVGAAARFCGAPDVMIMRLDGGLLRGAAATGPFADVLMRDVFDIEEVTLPLTRGSVSGRAVLDRRTIHVHDLAAESGDEYPEARSYQRRWGHRTLAAAPLLLDGEPLGVILLFRTEVRPFSDKQLRSLRIFADQAVIAIENVRLFNELEARTSELTQSVRELKALGEVGAAVSSTLDLETVLTTIVVRATELAGVDGGSIYEYDPESGQFHLRATDGLPGELVDALRAQPIRKGEGLLGRMADSGEAVEVTDIAQAGAYQSHVREMLIALGYRSLLAVPLLREDHLLGGLAVNRRSAGTFPPQVIELLKTFATQSALAIHNARLYRELGQKGRELEAASRHKSEFLANMSHELRTPLNAIIGFSEVLAERMFGEINDKQAEYLSDILESARHLLSLINDILDLSKIEAGRMELEVAEFSLPAAIDNTLTLVRERAHRRGIAIEHAVDRRLGSIRGDQRKVKQVLLNLLSNALKFTPDGGRIDVRADARDGVAEISVADTGVGIAPEDQAAVFEEFRQVGSATKRIEGTGLGLAISRRFVELHGGRIWVRSQLGAGSTFTFELPLG